MKLIGVIGSGSCDATVRQQAYDVGRGIAEAGYALVCGGLGGVMEGACHGASDAGGITVGILPGTSPDDANRYVSIPVATGIGFARNVIIVHSARVLIAIAGGPGTLSEIAFALQFGRSIIGLNTHAVAGVEPAASAAEALRKALARV